MTVDDGLDPADQPDGGGLVAQMLGGIAGESLAHVQQLQLQAAGLCRRLGASVGVCSMIRLMFATWLSPSLSASSDPSAARLKLAGLPGERQYGIAVGEREGGEIQRFDLERSGCD